MDTREWECVPTDDSTPINLQSHPRNTILGASLLIERLFPECPKEELMQKALDLAVEFNNALEVRTREVTSDVLEFTPSDPDEREDFSSGYSSVLEYAKEEYDKKCNEILKHFGIE